VAPWKVDEDEPKKGERVFKNVGEERGEREHE